MKPANQTATNAIECAEKCRFFKDLPAYPRAHNRLVAASAGIFFESCFALYLQSGAKRPLVVDGRGNIAEHESRKFCTKANTKKSLTACAVGSP
jgi:hypothetical protein